MFQAAPQSAFGSSSTPSAPSSGFFSSFNSPPSQFGGSAAAPKPRNRNSGGFGGQNQGNFQSFQSNNEFSASPPFSNNAANFGKFGPKGAAPGKGKFGRANAGQMAVQQQQQMGQMKGRRGKAGGMNANMPMNQMSNAAGPRYQSNAVQSQSQPQSQGMSMGLGMGMGNQQMQQTNGKQRRNAKQPGGSAGKQRGQFPVHSAAQFAQPRQPRPQGQNNQMQNQNQMQNPNLPLQQRRGRASKGVDIALSQRQFQSPPAAFGDSDWGTELEPFDSFSSPPAAEPSTRAVPCRFYVRGQCFNPNCQFSHDVLLPDGAAPAAAPLATSSFSQSQSQASTGEICKYFMRGTCRAGAKCQFVHPGQVPGSKPNGANSKIAANLALAAPLAPNWGTNAVAAAPRKRELTIVKRNDAPVSVPPQFDTEFQDVEFDNQDEAEEEQDNEQEEEQEENEEEEQEDGEDEEGEAVDDEDDDDAEDGEEEDEEAEQDVDNDEVDNEDEEDQDEDQDEENQEDEEDEDEEEEEEKDDGDVLDAESDGDEDAIPFVSAAKKTPAKPAPAAPAAALSSSKTFSPPISAKTPADTAARLSALRSQLQARKSTPASAPAPLSVSAPIASPDVAPHDPSRKAQRAARFTASAAPALPPRQINTLVQMSATGEEVEDEAYETLVNENQRIVGQCKDMCPERERLERQELHTLSVFEMIRGTGSKAVGDRPLVDHARAVKKYKRAAASQKLNPEDVRPLPVLARTSDYLMNEIVDSKEFAFFEVYRFVSDRMRALRQDFVCQGLKGAEVCTSYERMARFHILSFHELAEESKENFDPIQNYEKLSQALTSLRHYYRDNAASSDPFPAPNEGEMQSYLLFAHFNKNFQSTYEQTPPHLKSHPAVLFAVSVYNALRDGLYSTFFKLLRKANFLHACLMQSHFNRMRARALEIMCRSYMSFSISELTELLCFEDTDHCADFVQFHGLQMNADESSIQFMDARTQKRQTFITPSQNYPNVKSKRFIQPKKPKSIKSICVEPALIEGAALVKSAVVKSSKVVKADKVKTAKPVKSAATVPAPAAVPAPVSSFAAPSGAAPIEDDFTKVSKPIRLNRNAAAAPKPASPKLQPAKAEPAPVSLPAPSSFSSFSSAVSAPAFTFNSSPAASAPPPSAGPLFTGFGSNANFGSPPAFDSSAQTASAFSFTASPPAFSSFSPAAPSPSKASSQPAHTSGIAASFPSAPPALSSRPSVDRRTSNAPSTAATPKSGPPKQLVRASSVVLESSIRRHLLRRGLRAWRSLVDTRRELRYAQLTAREYHTLSLMNTAFLHWLDLAQQRRLEREQIEAQRRRLSQPAFGVPPAPIGLSNAAARARKLHFSSDSPSSAPPAALHYRFQSPQSELDRPPPAISLCEYVFENVVPELQRRNPLFSQIFFNLLVDFPHDFDSSELSLLAAQNFLISSLALSRKSALSAAQPFLSHFSTVLANCRFSVLFRAIFPSSRQSAKSSIHRGYQGALFMLSSPITDDTPFQQLDSLLAEDRARLHDLVSSLHPTAAVPLVIFYQVPLEFSSAAAAEQMIKKALGTPQIDRSRVRSVSLFALSSARADLSLRSALSVVASQSPRYPVLHRPPIVACLNELWKNCETHHFTVLQRSPTVSIMDRTMNLLSHFNQCLAGFRSRLFNEGFCDVSWPPLQASALIDSSQLNDPLVPPINYLRQRCLLELRQLLKDLQFPEVPIDSIAASDALPFAESLIQSLTADEDASNSLLLSSSESRGLLSTAESMFSSIASSSEPELGLLSAWSSLFQSLIAYRLDSFRLTTTMIQHEQTDFYSLLSQEELEKFHPDERHSHHWRSAVKRKTVDSEDQAASGQSQSQLYRYTPRSARPVSDSASVLSEVSAELASHHQLEAQLEELERAVQQRSAKKKRFSTEFIPIVY